MALAFKRLPRDLVRDINRAVRAELGPIWTAEVDRAARTDLDRRVLGPGRVKAGNPPVLQAATSVRGIGRPRRLKPAEHWHAFEFGANREKVTAYTRRSPKGGTHTVRRHVNRGLPPRIRTGRVIYPAASKAAPRAAALVVATVVRRIHLAAEGRTDG